MINSNPSPTNPTEIELTRIDEDITRNREQNVRRTIVSLTIMHQHTHTPTPQSHPFSIFRHNFIYRRLARLL